MLEELLNTVGTTSFERDGRLTLVEVKWSRADLTLRFDLWLKEKLSQSWAIECVATIESLIIDTKECGLHHWADDHPVIAQFTEPHEDLYFENLCQNSSAFLGELWLAHRKATDDWIPFDRYLNDQMPPKELFARNRGLLASGPSCLIEVYAPVLEKAEMQPKRLASDNDTYLEEAEMIHFGGSYVVAKKFIATMI